MGMGMENMEMEVGMEMALEFDPMRLVMVLTMKMVLEMAIMVCQGIVRLRESIIMVLKSQFTFPRHNSITPDSATHQDLRHTLEHYAATITKITEQW